MFWSADCVPNEVSMHDLCCGSISLMLPFLLAKALHGFDYHISYKHSHSLSQHLPKCFQFSVSACLRKNSLCHSDFTISDNSEKWCLYAVLSCHKSFEWNRTAALSAAQMSLILHHYNVIRDKNLQSSHGECVTQNSKHRIRFTSQLSWTVDSHTRAHTGTNTHINRRGLSSDPLFADQMTATLRVGRGGGGKEHGGSAFSTTICYYSCHSSHMLVCEANHS